MSRTCPYCHRIQRGGSAHTRHLHICLSNPAVLTVVRSALDAGDGRAKSAVDYDAAKPQGAPSSSFLAAQVWPNGWPGVARACGLQPAVVGRTRNDGGRPADEWSQAARVKIAGIDYGEAWLRAGVPVCGKSYEDEREVRWVVR